MRLIVGVPQYQRPLPAFLRELLNLPAVHPFSRILKSVLPRIKKLTPKEAL